MYQYYEGLIIREGTEGVPAGEVKKLFEEADWVRNLPEWQSEKFKLIFENSTWAFTVWNQDEMIAMVRIISDRIMAATIMDLVVSAPYRRRGIAKQLIKLSLQKLPHGDWFAHTSANNYELYRKCGFDVPDNQNNGTCVYYGYIQARKDGHRKS
ncbi:GNAT family N-acetyltransferase [Halobacillus rhizosphaerae]|uniref:GNAT family N-acetyltransferase n=1 Tax=Halobacillus rhizosphaerae TaxID=3064889 RepID=UPI00398AC930